MSKDPASGTYAASGVDYGPLDRFKREAQSAAALTSTNLGPLLKEEPGTRGESAYVIRLPDGSRLAHVEEGLGTKNLVTQAVYEQIDKSYWAQVAQDTVAMIVNDLITVGAMPVSVAMHIAVANSDWFNDARRSHDLIDGWRNACMLAGCAWGGGETPTLKDLVIPGTCLLSGSSIGFVREERDLIQPNGVRSGDAIVLVGSSGIHANGLTLARSIAGKLKRGYKTRIAYGTTYGEALLAPTVIYVQLMRELQRCKIPVHYAANVTGHGWRKLMRSEQELSYVIERIPTPQPIFRFMQKHGDVSDQEAYGNLNMGAGFALFVHPEVVANVLRIAERTGYMALHAGQVEEGQRQVIIEPLDITFSSSSLALR